MYHPSRINLPEINPEIATKLFLLAQGSAAPALVAGILFPLNAGHLRLHYASDLDAGKSRNGLLRVGQKQALFRFPFMDKERLC